MGGGTNIKVWGGGTTSNGAKPNCGHPQAEDTGGSYPNHETVNQNTKLS